MTGRLGAPSSSTTPNAKYYALTGSGTADRAAANGSPVEVDAEELVGAAD